MTSRQFNRLLELYKESRLSKEDWAALRSAILEGNYDHLIEEDLRLAAGSQEADEAWTEPRKEHILEDILAGIETGAEKAHTLFPFPAPAHPQKSYKSAFYRVASIAAACILPVAGIYLYMHLSARSAAVPAKPTALAPGGDKAILILGDGTRLTLDSAADGTLARQGSAQVIKVGSGTLAYRVGDGEPAKTVFYNTMITPRGGEYQLILPDGTHVWLNSASSIRYPNVFNGKDREVEITGEAYLQVAKNNKMPFVVSSRGMEVRVLGTEFDLMAYTDEEAIRTTLVSGAVKVVKDGASRLLKPGQQAILAPGGGSFNTAVPDLSQVLAWKEGRFRFDGVKITTIMRQIARWYDVDVEYQGPAPDNEFNGSVERKADAAGILSALEMTGNVHFNIEGKKIIVVPGPR